MSFWHADHLSWKQSRPKNTQEEAWTFSYLKILDRRCALRIELALEISTKYVGQCGGRNSVSAWRSEWTLVFHYLCLPACLVAQSCTTLCDLMDCSPPGSSVHRICQARTLEWVAISFCRGSSWPRDQTQVFWIAGRLCLLSQGSPHYLCRTQKTFVYQTFAYQTFAFHLHVNCLPLLWNPKPPSPSPSLFLAEDGIQGEGFRHVGELIFPRSLPCKCVIKLLFDIYPVNLSHVQYYEPPSIVIQALCLSSIIPWIYLSLPLYGT